MQDITKCVRRLAYPESVFRPDAPRVPAGICAFLSRVGGLVIDTLRTDEPIHASKHSCVDTVVNTQRMCTVCAVPHAGRRPLSWRSATGWHSRGTFPSPTTPPPKSRSPRQVIRGKEWQRQTTVTHQSKSHPEITPQTQNRWYLLCRIVKPSVRSRSRFSVAAGRGRGCVAFSEIVAQDVPINDLVHACRFHAGDDNNR